jgi:hypothetical protein
MSHLGERITSLVDGQLAVEPAERALMHIAGCPDCREAAETERLTKHRLAALGAPEPADRLIGRLLELAGPSGPMPPRSGHVPGSPRPELIASLTRVAVLGDREPTRAGEPARGSARPPARRGSSRPPLARAVSSATGLSRMVRVSRTSRNRMAAAMVGAACLVGAGVAGGVANGGVATTQVVPPVDSYLLEHSATAGTLPLGDQTVLWGLVGAGR